MFKKYYTLLLCLILGLSLQVKCQGVVGVWKLSIENSVLKFNYSEKSKYDSLSADVKQRIYNVMAGREFQFEGSGVLTVNLNGTLKQGSWKANSEDKILEMQIDNDVQYYEYSMDDNGHLILKRKGIGGIFSVLCLIRK